jgi:RND family efflux transporter MFP subunit
VIALSGNIEGIKTVRLGFLVAGRIDFIAVEEGEQVTKGELIASIDPESYSIARELAVLQVNQVQDEYDRLKLLHDRNSLSESDFSKISFGLQQAKAQLKLHSKNLDDTRLYSPIDGILLKKLCETGEITGSGIPLFVVSDIHKVNVTAFIPGDELRDIRIGQEASIMVAASGDTCNGKIIEVGAMADPATRSFTVKIRVENPGSHLHPGMIAEVYIPAPVKESALTIPVDALLHDQDDQVFVFVADTLRERAHRRNISTGRLHENTIEVTSGLKEGERIITGGHHKLTDGARVIIQ